MSEKVKIDRVRFAEVEASEATTWTFVEVYDGEGLRAVAEITCGDDTAEAARLTAELAGRLKGREIADEGDVEGMLGLAVADMQGSMALAAAVSGLRSAVSDLRAQMRGVTLTEELGGTPQESVLLYANIKPAPADAGQVAGVVREGGGVCGVARVHYLEVRAVRRGGPAVDAGGDTGCGADGHRARGRL